MSLIPWLRLCLSGSSMVSYALYSLSPYCRKEVRMCISFLKKGKACSPSSREKYLYDLLGILLHGKFASSSSYIIQSFILVWIWTHGYLCVLWVIIQYNFVDFVVHTDPALAPGSSFSWLLCLFDIILSSLLVFVKCFLIFWHYKMLQAHLTYFFP